MNKNNVSLKISAGRTDQFIRDSLPQIAFSGRSNVGKSSLINKLLNRKSLARVSGEPGKTITINYYEVDKSVYLVDLPGYGYAKRSDSEIKKWSSLVEGFFTDCSPVCVIQLIDLKVGITKDDANMLDWLYHTKTPFIVAATKSDKLGTTAKTAALTALRESEYIPDDVEIIPFSAKSGEGASKLWGIIEGISK